MIDNFDKNGIFRNIVKELNSLIITKYESEDSHANNTLESTIAFTLIQLYKDGSKPFLYIIGDNSNVERALFCLHRLHMIYIYNEHIRHHRKYMSCSLTHMGLSYARFMLNDLDSRHIRFILYTHNPCGLLHRFLFSFCFGIVPPSLMFLYMLFGGFQSGVLISICIAWCWLGILMLFGILYADTRTMHHLSHPMHWTLDNSKAQFLIFCNQHAVWHYIDPHALMHMIDRYMFNDHIYNKRSLVARNDAPWNRHFHASLP